MWVLASIEPLGWMCLFLFLGFGFAAVMTHVFGALRLGKRRYKTVPELVRHVSAVIGLAPTREDGAYPELGGVAFKGQLPSGRRAGVTFFTVSNGSASTTFVMLTVAADDTPRLTIRPETLLDRVGKAAGLKTEVAVGDRAFDERFLLVTDAPDRSREALSPELRAATTKLFDSFRVREVALREGSLSAELAADSTDPERYPEILALLDEAARTPDRRGGTAPERPVTSA